MQLTLEEQKAIASLKRLAKRWPDTLVLFASGGALSIRKPLEDGSYGLETEVDYVIGIRNDGGDGSDYGNLDLVLGIPNKSLQTDQLRKCRRCDKEASGGMDGVCWDCVDCEVTSG